ncbi:MAG TPA: hypothetical protein VHO70_22480 [Chitinispirillaceae bacterium]|nr:hypothetical protein [Chitinispirillaceae bacterium]
MSLFLSGNLYASNVIDRMFFAGAAFSYNDRLGHLQLSNGREQDIARAEIPSVGIVLGKRFALARMVRLQVPLNLEFGAANEDPYESFDGVKKSKLLQVSMIPVLQLPLRLNSEAAFYLSVGGGFHVVRFGEKNLDDFINSFTCASVSLAGGAGVEVMIARDRAFTLQYCLRYGKPVFYKYMKELVPFSGVTYKETFFTHSIQFLIMIYKGYRR